MHPSPLPAQPCASPYGLEQPCRRYPMVAKHGASKTIFFLFAFKLNFI